MSTKVKNSFGSNLTTNRPAVWPVGEPASTVGVDGQQLTHTARYLHGGAIRSEIMTNKDLVFKFYSNAAKGRVGGRVMMSYGGRYVA